MSIEYKAPGYMPMNDQTPPRQAKAAPLITCGVIILALAVGAGVLISSATRGQQAAATAQYTPTMTLDSWGATGTALYWQTFTPTAVTQTVTAEMTEEATAETTAEVTVTASSTPDDWQATGTAIYVTLSGMWTTTPIVEQLPTRTPVVWTPRPSSNGNSNTSGALPPSASNYINQVETQQAPIPPTARPPSQIVLTRQVTVVFVVTATPVPSETTAPPNNEPVTIIAPTRYLTETYTPTPSETPTATSTSTETPTATITPTETVTPTATFTETYTPTVTPTETPTLTDVPTEEIVQ